MRKNNDELLNDIEARLLQIKSMVDISLDNHNYKCAGYDEPFIDHIKAGNLLWSASDLLDIALNELNQIDLRKGGK